MSSPAPHAHFQDEVAPEEPAEERTRGGASGTLGAVLTGGLLTGIVFLLLAGADSLLAIRGPLTQIGTGVLCLLLGACGGFRDNMRTALRRGPNPFIIGLAVWSVAAFFVAPYRAPAAADLLRILAGALAYFVAAYALPSSKNVIQAATGLVVIGCALALTDFARLGVAGGVTSGFQYSFFATHEDVGSLMLLLVPLALAVFVTPEVTEKWRLPAFAATLLLVIALLLTRCRAAWIGEIVGLLFFFMVRSLRPARSSVRDNTTHVPSSLRETARRLLASPALLLVIGVVLFIGVSGAATVFSQRARSAALSLTDSGENIGTRLAMWDGAARMATEKPITGWGLGSYLVLEGRWTHLGDDPATVLTHGGTHFNIAHDYYVHWAADAGGVGLFLYVAAAAAVLTTLVTGYRSRPSLPSLQRAIVLGSASALAGSLVDALASPSYNFHGVYTVWWTIAGLGVASLRAPRSASRSRNDVAALAPTSGVAWAGAALAGLATVGIVLGGGAALRRRGDAVPRGVFRLVRASNEGGGIKAQPAPGPATASASVGDVVDAIFTDAAGRELPTAPGTRWRVIDLKNGDTATKGERKLDKGNGRTLRRATVTLSPQGGKQVHVEALYQDRYSRTYRAAFP